jgi:hypothetical protein
MAGSTYEDELVSECSINISQLAIEKKHLYTAMGYREKTAPGYIKRKIDTVFSSLHKIDDIRGGFRIFFGHSFSLEEQGFTLDSTFFNTGPVIASNIKGSDYIAFFLASAGNAISNTINETSRSGNHLESFVYDILGSEIAECAANVIESMVEAEVKKTGLSITRRYSPGYCEWDVAEQRVLFSCLPENFCHITLTPSALMVPIKSVSGIIGIGRQAKKRKYGCEICTMTSCFRNPQNRNPGY